MDLSVGSWEPLQDESIASTDSEKCRLPSAFEHVAPLLCNQNRFRSQKGDGSALLL